MQCHLCICMYTTGILEGPKRSKWDFAHLKPQPWSVNNQNMLHTSALNSERHKEVKTGLELNGTVLLEVSERSECVAVKIIKF